MNVKETHKLLEGLYAPGRFHLVAYDLYDLDDDMGLMAFLSYLMGVSSMVKAIDLNDGWFYRTAEQITNDVRQPKWRQERMLNKLSDGRLVDGEIQSWVEVEVRGWPAKRHIKIKYENIFNHIKSSKEGSVDSCDKSVATVSCNTSVVATEVLHPVATESLQLPKRSKTIKGKQQIPRRTASESVASAPSPSPGDKDNRRSSSIPFDKKGINKDNSPGMECAVLLRDAVAAKGYLDKRSNIKAWKRTFEERIPDWGLQEVKEILGWYVKHILHEGVPEAFSAITFFDKFPAIKAAMARSQKKGDTNLDVAGLNKDELWIYEQLKDLYWPGNTKVQLPSAIRKTRNDYTVFKNSLFKYMDSHSEYDGTKSNFLYRLCDYVDSSTYNPTDFALMWLKDTSEMFSSCPNARKLRVFSLSNEIFSEKMVECCVEYSGDARDWDFLIKSLGLSEIAGIAGEAQ
jgi:hypothetical protein